MNSFDIVEHKLRIPTKPHIESSNTHIFWSCPYCGKHYKIEDKFNRCTLCGQVIDWSVGE